MNKSDFNTNDAASDFQGKTLLDNEECAKQHNITYPKYAK